MGGDWKEMLYASQRGDLELLKFYFKMGVNPDYQHPEFLTNPLLESIRFGHLEIAGFLLENGANPLIEEIWDEKSTPLSIAIMTKNKDAVTLLQKYIDVGDAFQKINEATQTSKGIFQKILKFWK
ncbi:MAG: ankyrin repeat domain-containing protein [Saprospiraceae bacterium]